MDIKRLPEQYRTPVIELVRYLSNNGLKTKLNQQDKDIKISATGYDYAAENALLGILSNDINFLAKRGIKPFSFSFYKHSVKPKEEEIETSAGGAKIYLQIFSKNGRNNPKK